MANIPRPVLPDPTECGYEMSDIGLKIILMTKDPIPNSALKLYLVIVQQTAKIIVVDVENWDYLVIFIVDAQSHVILSPVIIPLNQLMMIIRLNLFLICEI